MKFVKKLLGWLLLLPGAAVAAVVGLAAFFGLAFVVTHPVLLGVVALAVCGATTWGLAHVPARWAWPRFRHLAAWWALVVTLACGTAGGYYAYRPVYSGEPDVIVPSGLLSADLPTGSRLAYRLIPASGPARRGRAIFVHGGPGAEALSNTAFGSAMTLLAARGFDVCLYDQIGCGLSGRLEDLRRYEAPRYVADLEALRRHLGWPDPVLIGESWGAQLIARYAAEYPNVPAAAVLVSPGPLRLADWKDRETGSAGDRLPPDQEQAFNDLLDARLVTAMVLMRINPRAAFRFLPEAEAEQYGSAVLAALAPGAVCDPGVLREGALPSMNIWVAQMVIHGLKRESPSRLDALSEAGFPVLVLRGDCDYGHQDIANEYVDTFPRAEISHIPDTGHFLLLENPDAFLEQVDGFLAANP